MSLKGSQDAFPYKGPGSIVVQPSSLPQIQKRAFEPEYLDA